MVSIIVKFKHVSLFRVVKWRLIRNQNLADQIEIDKDELIFFFKILLTVLFEMRTYKSSSDSWYYNINLIILRDNLMSSCSFLIICISCSLEFLLNFLKIYSLRKSDFGERYIFFKFNYQNVWICFMPRLCAYKIPTKIFNLCYNALITTTTDLNNLIYKSVLLLYNNLTFSTVESCYHHFHRLFLLPLHRHCYLAHRNRLFGWNYYRQRIFHMPKFS